MHHKREIEMPITKKAKKKKMLKIIVLKLQPMNNRKRKLRGVERKRGKIFPAPNFRIMRTFAS